MLHKTLPPIHSTATSPTAASTYQPYLETAQAQDQLRMGYPLTGSVYGFFTPTGWQKSNQGTRLIDRSALGIKQDSISDTLMLNIGDPESSLTDESSRTSKDIHYPEDIENDVIKILTHYFSAEANSLKGYVTSGGTEANLASIWWLRNYVMTLSKQNSKADSQKVILYASKDTHYSCAKVCQILNIELCNIDSLPNGQINVAQLSNVLNSHMQNYPQRPMIVWLNAGTTVLGAIDDIKTVHAIVNMDVKKKNGICAIHTDGAILGVTLPLLHNDYQKIFDYTDSLVMSGHKLLATTLACGVVLTKKSLVNLAFENRDIAVGYVHGIKDITITGGRSCLPVMQIHQSLKALDFDRDAVRFRKLISTCLHNAEYLAGKLTGLIGSDHVTYNPKQFNVVFQLQMQKEEQEWLKEKYTLMPLPDNQVCITVFPNVDNNLILSFLDDYAMCKEKEYQFARSKL